MREFTIYLSLALFVAACSLERAAKHEVKRGSDAFYDNNTNMQEKVNVIACAITNFTAETSSNEIAAIAELKRTVDELAKLVEHYTTPLPWYRRVSSVAWAALALAFLSHWRIHLEKRRKAQKP